MIGRTLAHYQVIAAIGAGGMGEVFRAVDTRLGREVALKVLPADVATDPERLDRFRREAKALAALDHPGIVTVFSVEEAEGVHFLTMQLVEGTPLDDVIPEHGLPLDRLLVLARRLAEALAAAHDRGIVHRDLKPANVMVTAEDNVKILDFGLAKVAADRGGRLANTEQATLAVTREGVVMGTVPYMSPEQLQGKPVDARSDLFSLGAIFYEMATGKRPFHGDTAVDLMSSILRDVPEPLTIARADLPEGIDRLARRALAKEPSRRFQSARDLVAEILNVQDEIAPAGASLAVAMPRRTPTSGSGKHAAVERFWVAVLPFGSRGGDADLEALAEGIGEEIITGLSRFSYLRVIARTSTMRYAGQSPDVREVGRDLGARYVLEGSIRKAGPRVRVAAQLVDADSGAHLWAETYDRDFRAEELFELQDDVVARIVSTVADMFGVLPRAMSEVLRSKRPEDLTPYEAVLRAFGYVARLDVEEHALVRSALELAVQQAPGDADAWAMLSNMYAEEFKHDFSVREDSLDRALEAARRAVAAAPSNHLAYFMLAQAHFFRREVQAFRTAAERSIALNTMDGSAVAFLGILLEYAGDKARGRPLIERAMQLNPHHPGWYRFAEFFDSYRQRDYVKALEVVLAIDMPSYFYTRAALAMAYGQLGDIPSARRALAELHALKPDFAIEARREFGKWLHDDSFVEAVLEGLRKAGLAIPREGVASGPEIVPGEPTDASIAVLPFTDMSPARDQQYLCEGMAEEIMNALMAAGGMRVAARASAFRARERETDVTAIGEALAVGHVLDGSVRTAGSRLRVTAQLIDASKGYQLWSERFDRELEDVFAVQDEIAAGVVAAVRERLGTASRAVAPRRKVGNVEAYQHYLKGRHFRYTKNDHLAALRSFERAVELDPQHAPSWIGIAEVKALAAAYSLAPALQTYAEATEALARARSVQGSSAAGLHVAGMLRLFVDRDLDGAIHELRRAVELAPDFVEARGWTAVVLTLKGLSAEAEDQLARGREADPLAAYPYGMAAVQALMCGKAAQAERHSEQGLSFDEQHSLLLWTLGIARVTLGRSQEAIPPLQQATEGGPRGGFIHGILGWALAMAGRTDEAREVLVAIENRPAGSPTVVSGIWLRAALGDMKGAWSVLQAASQEHQGMLCLLINLSGFDPLRDDPRFDRLVAELGLPVQPRPARPATRPPSPALPVSTPPATARPSIVVLPFVNNSDDPDNEYFADGLTEELIADLAGIKALSVISRTSAMLLKGTDKDLRTLGRELGVRYVLEGSVRKAGASLRITAQLVDASSDVQLWSDKYAGTVSEVFEVQERVSREIVRALDLRLSADESRRLAERPIADARAFELYLQARAKLRRISGEAITQADRAIAEAIAIEGETPPLRALRAWSLVMTVRTGLSPDLRPLDEAEAIARALLERDAEQPEAHAILGFLSYERGRMEEASRHLRRALALRPNDTDSMLFLAATYFAAGHGEGAAEIGKRMVAGDPLAADGWMVAGGAPWFAGGSFAANLPALERSVALDPASVMLRWAVGYAYAAVGRLQEASRQAASLAASDPEAPYTHQLLALIEAIEGRHEAAIERIAQVDVAPLDGHTTFHLAEPLAMAGAHDRALDLIERVVNGGFYPHRFLAQYCPFLEPLRALPRFAPILERARERTEAFLRAEAKPL